MWSTMVDFHRVIHNSLWNKDATPNLKLFQPALGFVVARKKPLFPAEVGRVYDDARIVRLGVMLHVKHQSQVRDSRMIVHTSEFRAEEKRFLQYREAKHWLKGF